MMARVRNRNTKPEMVVRSLLHRMGYRFRLHRRNLPGSPDIVLPRHKKVIFVHGCFWHGHSDCKRAARPTSNTSFWNDKINRNINRDLQALQNLSEQNWQSLTIWDCELRDLPAMESILRFYLSP